ncbi:MAG: D-glycero-D-manno-heptose 1,7-bisphosphate phosphatase [Glaciecola sp.]|jgi:D-glycero-D-manno-heptose 1,7-bisphosphate phosphatase
MNKTLFLDRDGVINVNHGYVYQTDNFDFIDGIVDLVKRANQSAYKVVVVTNQSGIGRGYYSEQQFLLLNDWMIATFAKQEARIDKVYFCPHHPTLAISHYLQDCDCRKPKVGMAVNAQNDLSIDVTQSIMVGDKQSDVDFAINAKISNMYLFNPTLSSSKNTVLESGTLLHQISKLNMVTFP